MNPSRRHFLRSAAASSILFPGIMNQLLADDGDPLAIREPHFAPKAKNVIFLFMTGGVSHVDTFDPKPELIRQHGKEIASDHPAAKNRDDYKRIYLKRPQWEFQPYGQSGTEVSSLFPHVGECVDDIALIRSMYTSHVDHYFATLGMHTGSFSIARPSMGAWVTYGLGSMNRNLPGFVVIAPAQTYGGTQVYSNDFLPGAHQGTLVVPGNEPVVNVQPRVPTDRQALELAALREMNQEHLAQRPGDPLLTSRLQTFETAFGMQMAVPDAFDFADESQDTLDSYGLQPDQKTGFGWHCLAARRLVERGVRFVELIDVGSSKNWDAHGDMMTHEPLAKNVDQPIAALIRDLKQRGMFDETLIVWTTEFGRTPFNKSADHKGREHHPTGFSSWLAGAGVKRGIVHGATDEIGMYAVDRPVHVRDFHATILHLMGLDHEKLAYRHAGLDFRLTGVEHANVVKEILA